MSDDSFSDDSVDPASDDPDDSSGDWGSFSTGGSLKDPLGEGVRDTRALYLPVLGSDPVDGPVIVSIE